MARTWRCIRQHHPCVELGINPISRRWRYSKRWDDLLDEHADLTDFIARYFADEELHPLVLQLRLQWAPAISTALIARRDWITT